MLSLQILDDFLHHLTQLTTHEAKTDPTSPFVHLRPDYKAPPLPSSAAQDSAAQEEHAALACAVVQVHKRLYMLSCRVEVSNSTDEVKAIKKLLKTLKIVCVLPLPHNSFALSPLPSSLLFHSPHAPAYICLQDIVEKSIDEGEKETEPNGPRAGASQRDGAGQEEREEEGRREVEEIDGMDILKSLETHVAAKRGLLEANEDDLDADATSDLTDKRMTFARTISPIKKVLPLSSLFHPRLSKD